MKRFLSLSILVAASFGAAVPAAAQAVRQAPGEPGGFALPDGNAKQLVQERCIGCHDLRRVVNSNYSPEEWQNVVNMMKSAGAPIDQAEADQIRDYLRREFPRQAAAAAGSAARGGQHQVQAMADADAGIAAARSIGDA